MARRYKRPESDEALDRRPDTRAGSRWRLRNWRLRTKLIAVLLIPMLTVLALISLHVRADLEHAGQLVELAAHSRVDAGVNAVVSELQRERDLTVRYVAGERRTGLDEVRDQRSRVDQAAGAFAQNLAEQQSMLSPASAAELKEAQSRLDALPGLRYSGEFSNSSADSVLTSYSDLISGILDLSDQAVAEIADAEVARLRLAGNALARVKDQMSVKRAVLGQAFAEGEVSDDRLRALLGADAQLVAAQNDYRKFATPAEQRSYEQTVAGPDVQTANTLFELAITRTENGQRLSGLDSGQWDQAISGTVDLAYQFQQSLQVQTQQRCDALATDARRSAIVNAAAVFGALLLCAVLAVVIGRSLLRPLRILRNNAFDVAEHRLPAAVDEILADPHPDFMAVHRGVAPVPVFTREEVGQVARAFDAVHGQAVRLAGEQALLRENINAMFVNLSKRSQDLVERQLGVLDRMEADEQDPDTLGGLFELDHLATRMRRNSENLLVLTGHDFGDAQTEPVAAEEIIGAALSEVEHYQRIELTAMPEIAVRGEACNDLVHVISELLENATLYSPSEKTVTVISSLAADGAWHVHITDQGAGMPQPEIDRANKRLANPPEVDVEVSRRMGLFVVATLANRHDIQVRLRSADGGGLVATVVVPSGLVIEHVAPVPEPLPAPEPPPAPVPLPSLAPIPLPEPEEEPESELDDTVSIPVVRDEPRRAPSQPDEVDWPTSDKDAFPPEEEEPTERMPAYQKVLSQWFTTGEHWPVSRRVPAEPAQAPEWPAEPEWPSADDDEVVDGRRSHLPHQVRRRAKVFDPPTLSLDPDEVRHRMSRLQNGFARARDVRGTEN
ncbi:nitrate- and nitrite sensing domain-containing protein [Amycolatopsis endophytica]|uniref:histidine kinase n=1 Tax=Amycolatopsis endophytica TaxID=860233 RepID=A0A853B3H4_9PSEU|nr:nitrate- and nitrite sensing domain-containing protein [Amycolatopsis endophytica]NYI89186.1 signal transduction histidine kinase [Amycolatopsis endophytica]